MPSRNLTVESLREELTKFRVDFASQDGDRIKDDIRKAINLELHLFFESRGDPATAMSLVQPTVQKPRQSLGVFGGIDTGDSTPREMMHHCDANQDVGWSKRHRKSYMLSTVEDEHDQADMGSAAGGRRRSSRMSKIQGSRADLDTVPEVSSGRSSQRNSDTNALTTANVGLAFAQLDSINPASSAGMLGWGPAPSSSAMSSMGLQPLNSAAGQSPSEFTPTRERQASVSISPIVSASPSHNDLESLEAQPMWAKHHRKAKRISTVENDGFAMADFDDSSPGPYKITGRERNSYFPLPEVATTPSAGSFSLAPGSESERNNNSKYTRAWNKIWAPIRATVLHGYRLDSCIVVFIILNAISVGVQTDYMARNWTAETPLVFRLLNLIFCTVFTVEIALKLCVHGWRFFQAAGWRWNIFDAVVISGQVAEELSLLVADAFQPRYANRDQLMFFSVVRTLRVFRLIRVMRIVSIIHLVGDLRKFVVAITDSMQSLGWTVLLLLLITYIFAVYLTQLVTDHKVRHWKSEEVRRKQYLLHDFYGSLDKSMLSLYETISDGIHWHEVMDPLKDITPWLSVLFAVYISGIVFALMNVVTGIFVDSAIRAAETDKKRNLIDSMRSLFEGADEDGNGTLTFEEFEGQLSNRFMQSYLQAIDLDEEEAVMLFQLLDIDESGEIDADDFVSGCIKLHGGAKAIDLAAFVHEYRRTAKQWSNHFDLVERSLSWLCEQQSKLKF